MLFILLELFDVFDKFIVEDVISNSMLVIWNELKDNGSFILGYWFEKREVNSIYWFRVNRNFFNFLKINVEGLLEGFIYVFRVCVENVVGFGKFSFFLDFKIVRDLIGK